MIHIDYAPIKECKHPELTYGEICVKCNECERFTIPTRSSIKIMSQYNPGIPPFWEPPQVEATFLSTGDLQNIGLKGKGARQHWTGQREVLNSDNFLDMIPSHWHNRELPYVRWWIEGRKY